MKTPQLRRHKSGHYFVRWGGRDRYLTKNKQVAEKLYLDQLDQWRQWRMQKDERREVEVMPIDFDDMCERFLDAKRIEHGVECEHRYRKHLSRIRGVIDEIKRAKRLRFYFAENLTPVILNDFKLRYLEEGKAPRTINHDLTTIRVMYNWAASVGLIKPMNLTVVKNVPVGPVDDLAVDKKTVQKGFAACPPLLQPWFAINYLALLRPSEVVRVAKAQGRWHASLKGVFILDRGKVDFRVSIKRHVVFSPLAEKWVRYGWQTIQDERDAGRKPLKWNSLDSYSEVVRRFFDQGPKVLQKSAASHLAQCRGVAPADVELLLGHIKNRLSVTYYAPHWKKLRTVAAKLKLPAP